MNRILLISLLTLFAFSSNAQTRKIDSLRLLLGETQEDTSRLKIYSQLAVSHFYYNKVEGLKYLDTLYSLSEKYDDSQGMGMVHNFRAVYYQQKGEFDKAINEHKSTIRVYQKYGLPPRNLYTPFYNLAQTNRLKYELDSSAYYFQKALQIVESENIERKYTTVYNALGQLEFDRENYSKAMEYFISGKKYLEKTDMKTQALTTYQNIGLVYYRLGQYDKSIQNLRRAITESEKINYPLGVADAKKDLSKIYNELDTLTQESIANLEFAVKVYRENQDNQYLTEALSDLGYSQLRNNEPKLAISSFEESLKVANQYGIDQSIASSHIGLATGFLNVKQYSKSEGELKKVYELNKKSKLEDKLFLQALKNQYLLDLKTGNTRSAEKSVKKYNDLQNKINNEKRLKTVNDIETKYQVTQKENENLQLKQEKQEQELKTLKANRQRGVLGVGLLGALLLGGLAFSSYKKSNQQKQRIERLQRELHHRMKNNLAIVDVFLETTEREIKDEKVVGLLDELRNRIYSIANVHELLVDNKDVTNLNLHHYINELVKNVTQTSTNDNISIQLNVPESIDIESSKSFPVGLIVNEFLTNSFKYAFPNQEQGKVSIDIEENAGEYLLSLKDDGVGLQPNFDIEKTKSFGLKIMMLLAEQLDGSFDLQSTDGVEVKVSFPK